MDYKEKYIQFLRDITVQIDALTKLCDVAAKELLLENLKEDEKLKNMQSANKKQISVYR